MKYPRLTRARYRELTRALRLKGASSRAGELVLCDGMTLAAAGAAFGISKQAVAIPVSRVLTHALLPGQPCPTCGDPIKKRLTRPRP